MKNLPGKFQILPLVLLILVVLLLPSSAHAQSPVRSFTIIPPSVLTPLAPSGQSEGTLKIRNDTDEAVTFNVLIQDFIVTDTHGTPTLLPPGTLSNKYSAASWIGVSPTRFTVPAHERQELTYFMRVPQDARAGGHYAAVVYAPITEKGVDSTGATVNSQLGTLFSITIDGPIKQEALVTRFFTGGFQEYGPVDIETQIKNMGDEHIRPVGKITVTNMLGGKEDQATKQHNIFPEAARDYVNIMGQKWMFGRYVATFEGTYGRTNNLPLTATVAFWVFPWKLILVIILFIVAAVLGYMLLTKKKDDDTTPRLQSPDGEANGGQAQGPRTVEEAEALAESR